MDGTNTTLARCRLCLRSIRGNSYVALGDFERNMLETLAPLIRLGITPEPKLCDKCAKSLQISYDFKALWLQNNENVKKLLILRDLHPVPCVASCGMCGEVIREVTVDGDETDWIEMVEKCVPELDVCFGDKITACGRCVGDLRSVYTFINKFMDVEKKIVDYCSAKSKDFVDLDDIISYYNIQTEYEETSERNESREIVNEDEREATRNVDDSGKENMTQSSENFKETIVDGHTESSVTLNQNSDASVTVPLESARLEGSSVSAIQDSNENTNETQTNNLTSPKRRKKKPSPQYQCDQCSYVSKHQSALKSHLIRHKDPSETTMFKCAECDHETKRKTDLQAHMIIHRDISELKTFKCNLCPYKATRKGDLKLHSYSHQPKIFKCDHCPYVTGNLAYLTKKHALLHKDRSELHMYKCTKCSYEHYNKGLFIRHAKGHKAKADIPKYKCNWCKFETHNKMNLRHHMDLHKSSSEISMCECYQCGYKTRRKSHLKDHMKKHSNYSGETYRCANCEFQTKRKGSLVKHMRMHMNPSSLKWYHCELCKYKTTWRANLYTHTLTHKKKKRV